MADASVGTAPKKKKGFFSSKSSGKKVGDSTVPCQVGKPGVQLVVGVCSKGIPAIDGAVVHIVDSKGKKKKKATTKAGLASFKELAAGSWTITVELGKKLLKTYAAPPKQTAAVTVGGKVTNVFTLESNALDLTASIVCAEPEGVFNPTTNTGEPIKLSLVSVGTANAFSLAEVKLNKDKPGVSLFTDEACTVPLPTPIPGAGFAAGTTAVIAWAKSNAIAPCKLTLQVTGKQPTPAPKKPVAVPANVTSTAVTLTWKDAPLTAVFGDVTPLVIGQPFLAKCTLTDAKKIGASAKMWVVDKDSVKVNDIGLLDLTAPNVNLSWSVPWDGKDAAGVPVSIAKSPYELVLEAEDGFSRKTTVKKKFSMPPPQSYFKLSFSDPEGNERALPKDLPVELVYADASVDAVKIGDDGVLLGKNGQPGVILDVLRGDVVLRIPASTKYVVCEPPTAAARTAALLKTPDEMKALVENDGPGKGSRAFLLPDAAWPMADAAWTVTGDGGRYVVATGTFTAQGAHTGAADAPVKLLLAPRWQFARFTYQDRFRGGTDQVSSLPLFVAGLAMRPAGAAAAKIATRSNWTFGASPEVAVQALPWIIKKAGTPAVDLPAATSELRFETAASTFIETPALATEARKWFTGTKAEPDADRLRFYDMPLKWRSQGWYVRPAAKGRSVGKFFGALATMAERLGTKTAPLIFSLDDMVLYTCASLAAPEVIEPLPALGASVPVAVFHSSFAKGGAADLSEEGVYNAPDEPTPIGTTAVIATHWPASKDDGLRRAAGGIQENYVFLYADWSRLVIADGNLFDVFAQRSPEKAGDENRVVGARAAVRFNDFLAPMQYVSLEGTTVWANPWSPPVPGSRLHVRPKRVRSKFLASQAILEFQGPHPTSRMDTFKVAASGTVSATDFDVRYGRNSSRVDEGAADENLAQSIGRFDAALIRCCGVDPADATKERAVQLSYYRAAAQFAADSVEDTEPKRKAWVKRTLAALTKRWNGPDGTYNSGRRTIEPRASGGTTPKLTIEAVRFMQNLPEPRAAFRFKVVKKVAGARDYMSGTTGITQAQDGNELTEASGWYTMGHEMGHAGGLFDDYAEIWTHASYDQPAVPMIVPGDPYDLDSVTGNASMMKACSVVRTRHFWLMAEWVYAQLPTEVPMQLRGPGEANPYFLPHHRRSRTPEPVAYRSFASTPLAAAFDVATSPTDKAHYDAYLYALGDDVFSRNVLPQRAGDAGGNFYDGVLVITVAMCLSFTKHTNHDVIKDTAGKVVALLRSKFSDRVVTSFTAHGQSFARCLVQISPRIIVGSHAGDDTYDKGLGLDLNAGTQGWLANTSYLVGVKVHPTVSNGFLYEMTGYTATAPALGKVSGGAEPVWPTNKDAAVEDNHMNWKAVPAGKERKQLYTDVLKNKLASYPLHLQVELGASVSELAKPPTSLPRIRIANQELTVWRVAFELAQTVEKAQLKAWKAVLAARSTASTNLNNAKQQLVPLEQALTAAQATLDGLIQQRTQKNQALATAQAANQAPQVATLQGELATLETQITAATADRDAKKTPRDEKKTEVDNLTPIFNSKNADAIKVKTASSVAEVLAKAKEMAAALFTSDATPMTDTGYDALQTQAGQLKSGTTVPLVIGKLTGTGPAVVAVKAALEILSSACTPGDVADVGVKLGKLAKAINEWGATGANPTEQKAKLAEARLPLTTIDTGATARATSALNEQKLASGWTALNYTDAFNVAQASNGCSRKVVEAVRKLYVDRLPATFEEQLTQHFGAWLGLSADPTSTAGFAELVNSVATAGSLGPLTIPRPPPPPVPVVVAPVVATTPPSGGSVPVPDPAPSGGSATTAAASSGGTPSTGSGAGTGSA